jgi:penicillin-binding protein 2
LGLASLVTRIRLMQWFLAGAGLIVWGRLVQLQGWDHAYWKARGEQIRIWDEKLPARRGRLLDRNGTLLADNEPWVGGKPLTPERQARLAEGLRDDPVEAQRGYPAARLCAHAVGYASQRAEGEWQGREGLEQSLEKRLRGQDGQRSWLVTSQGQKLRLVRETPAQAGQDVTLTLDLPLQRVAHAALASVLSQLGSVRPAHDQPAGAVVVMHVESGEVLALVSLPDFDPNVFVRPGQDASIRALLQSEQAPLLNRAIAAQIPAASTFKIVTASAALQEGLITPQRRFYCAGARMIGAVPFHCFVRSGHGDLSFEDSLSLSCDCAYYDLGLELGGKRLASWARRWGLGQVTGIDLPGEQPGLVPDMSSSTQGQQANLSIGQGDLLVTPMQMARLVAGVANQGRLPRPRLGQPTSGASLRVELKPAAWERLRAGLQGTVAHGTAAGAGAGGLGLAGKTGTVENQPSTSNPRGYNHTWFVGYSLEKKLAIAVFLERSGGYGGALAAPIATQILKTWPEIEEKSIFR